MSSDKPGQKRVWFITGGSSGLGLALTQAVLERSELVVATARNPAPLAALERLHGESLMSVAMDVRDSAQIGQAVARVHQQWGRIDVLVNNAGFGVIGAVEEVSDAQARRLFDTNLFGLLSVTRAALPGMRARREGHIVNMSSMGGFGARAGIGIYCASKFATEGLSEAMALELAPLGIRVTVITLGLFRTNFFNLSLELAEPIQDYEPIIGAVRKEAGRPPATQPGDPARAAQAIIKAVDDKNSPFRLVLGRDALARVRGKLAMVREQIEVWEEVSLSTDFS